MAPRKTRKRSYSSPLRKAQAEKTRARLIRIGRAFLTKHGPESMSLPKIARLAEVSVGTVYGHFPTEADLLLAVAMQSHSRLGVESDVRIDHFVEAPLRRFPRFASDKNIVAFSSHFAPFQRLRAADRPKLKASVIAEVRTLAPDLTDAELGALSGPIFAMMAPRVWFYFEDVWGLSTADAARAASWAIRAMLNELRRDPTGFRSVPPPPPPTDNEESE